MQNQDQFFLDSGLFGWIYKILSPLEWLMTQILAFFHQVFVLLGMPRVGLSWVLAIIMLVLLVHAGIFPVFVKQMKSMRRMQALQPKLMKIRNKYKGKSDQPSREAMNREVMKLYQDNHANPAGSCVPMFIQSPVFMCMFYVLSVVPFIASGKREALGAFTREVAQEFAQTELFGVQLTTTFGHANGAQRIVIGVFIFLMCAAMWYMQYNNMRRNLPRASMEGTQYRIQQAMTWGFPLMYIFSGLNFPFSVLLYWLTNNVANMLRSLWQVNTFPTPGSPAAEEKEVRDHERENTRRKREGRISLEEEALEQAKLEAQRREEQGFQRAQPQRKHRKK